MKEKTAAVIVIPIVRTDLHDFELKSLAQCFKILKKWPKYFLAPEGIDLTKIKQLVNEEVKVAYFPTADFASISDYNRLLTSQRFYKRFIAYDYMLIYQLDAYVFEDQLAYWCGKGYDFIGAPAFFGEDYERLTEADSERYSYALETQRLVFNGGFSLRKIKAMIRLLRIHNTLFPRWKGNEDMLFSLTSRRFTLLRPFVSLPSWKEALSFAFEKSPEASYEINNRKLPFGCHAWQRYHPDFWAKFM